MTNHYRHYRVANRDQSSNSPSYMTYFEENPLIVIGGLALLLLFFIKCLTCHR